MAPSESAETPAPKEPAPKTERRTAYCPTCKTRYAVEADRCVSCDTALVAEQPRDVSVFRPAIDLPVLAAGILFAVFYWKLPGEARSFGLIALVVGVATLVTFRAIAHAEWLGRR